MWGELCKIDKKEQKIENVYSPKRNPGAGAYLPISSGSRKISPGAVGMDPGGGVTKQNAAS